MNGKKTRTKTHEEQATGLTKRQINAAWKRGGEKETAEIGCKTVAHCLEPLAEWGGKLPATGFHGPLISWRQEKFVEGRIARAMKIIKKLSEYHDLTQKEGEIPGSTVVTLPNGETWTVWLGEKIGGVEGGVCGRQVYFYVGKGA